MDWTAIPSLPALRAFEAAARTGSLAAAGAALNVTHAAISQHVRALEKDLGTPLLIRGARGVAPTPEGAALAAALTEGFGRIAAATEALRAAQGARPLRVALTPSFAENWLMPRIGGFWAAHPEVEIALIPSCGLADVAGGDADLAIRYGAGDWPGLDAEAFLPGRFVVVAAPGFAAAHPDLGRVTWSFESYSEEIRDWAMRHGLVDAETRLTLESSNGIVLAAVRAGLAVSAQTLPNVAADLDAGTLVALREVHEDEGGYHLVTRPGPQHPGLRAFRRWLMAQVGAERPLHAARAAPI